MKSQPNYLKIQPKNNIWKNIFKEILFVAIGFLAFRTLLAESFYVPTGSMKPNILEGDSIVGTKYNYGYSKYSLPFFPNVFSGRVLNFYPPKRGDIIIFYALNHKEPRLIKRIIGVPGDRVQMKDNRLYINGAALALEPIEDNATNMKSETNIAQDTNNLEPKDVNNMPDQYKRYIETLPNGRKYIVQYLYNTDNSSYTPYANTEEFIVAPDQYFVMGDNRDQSLDSRSGLKVYAEQIIAKAAFTMFSNEYNLYTHKLNFGSIIEFLKSFRTGRFFKKAGYNPELEKLQASD